VRVDRFGRRRPPGGAVRSGVRSAVMKFHATIVLEFNARGVAPAGRARRADVAPAVMPDQRLRAPWRLRYVQGERKPEGCLFCLAAQPGDDVARHVLHRSERCFVMLNAFPYNSGHLMVSPRRHAGSIEDPPRGRAAGADDPHPAGTGARCARVTAPTGSTWASTSARSWVPGSPATSHLHVVPRWPADSNFMAVTADTRVLPRSLEDSYAPLRERFGG
jgi:ATP adenylyltransferase